MVEQDYQPGESYDYPLIIKKLLDPPLIHSPDREIVYGSKHRYDYRSLNDRIHRLANGLESLGIQAGDTIAVFDYDSHRYLECFFAIPMMGAVLQTVNWRLSAEQIAYTIGHAEADMIIINSDFFSILENLKPLPASVKKAPMTMFSFFSIAFFSLCSRSLCSISATIKTSMNTNAISPTRYMKI